ncbi:MAG: Trm112 family protein [Acidobacteria bacterium]|nr:Trm112 family protein [Acidobacteriota bacterium]
MAVSPELIEILRCPKCKSKVELRGDDALKCVDPECSLVYPVRDDIPVMLVEEATAEKTAVEK